MGLLKCYFTVQYYSSILGLKWIFRPCAEVSVLQASQTIKVETLIPWLLRVHEISSNSERGKKIFPGEASSQDLGLSVLFKVHPPHTRTPKFDLDLSFLERWMDKQVICNPRWFIHFNTKVIYNIIWFAVVICTYNIQINSEVYCAVHTCNKIQSPHPLPPY